MLKLMTFALLALAPQAAAACTGADLSIANVAVKDVTPNGGLNEYHFQGVVTNNGPAGQPSNTLQSVDVYQSGQKIDTKGIPPLKAGQSYAFDYDSQRSAQAGNGSSMLTFKLDVRQPVDEVCTDPHDNFEVTF